MCFEAHAPGVGRSPVAYRIPRPPAPSDWESI